MWLQAKGTPDAGHRHVRQLRGLGHGARTPVCGLGRRRLQGARYHGFHLGVGNLSRSAGREPGNDRTMAAACAPRGSIPRRPAPGTWSGAVYLKRFASGHSTKSVNNHSEREHAAEVLDVVDVTPRAARKLPVVVDPVVPITVRNEALVAAEGVE